MPTKQWLEANKEAIKEKKRAYYLANKEAIKQRARENHHANKEANREKKKVYYEANKNKLKQKATEYYFCNKEARKEINDLRHKRYREENKEAVRQSKAKWLDANRERANLTAKLWRQANPIKCLLYVRNRQAAQLQRTPKWLTDEDFKAIEAFYWEAKSKEIETGIKHQVDHIIPLRGKLVSGLHVPENLRVITAAENQRKINKFEV